MLFVVQVVLVLTLQATLSENFIAFLESTLNFEHFKKKNEPRNLSISEIMDSEKRRYLNV